MIVNEIFKSIQGESSFCGFPCTFIRLSGCNLNCSYCDTAYASSGDEMSIDSVIYSVKKHGVKIVEITGGEPLLQEDTPLLIDELIKEKFKVLIETNGSLDISILNPCAVRIMDIKCPGSGMSDYMDWNNIKNLTVSDEVKFVIGDMEDYIWSLDKIKRYSLEEKVNILFSSVYEKLEPRLLVEWMLEDKVNARFQLQLHKYIWNPHMRGV